VGEEPEDEVIDDPSLSSVTLPDPDGIKTETQQKLMQEASSLAHLMSHLGSSPFCEACRRAKLLEKYARSRKGERKLSSAFGELVTCDRMVS
jgi:hypothetical protein